MFPFSRFIAPILLTYLAQEAQAYVTLSTPQNAYTFKGDTTYYITTPVSLSGITTFEAGTVIKYASGASLTISDVNWKATAFRPVLMVAKDDNSVGDSIS